MKPSQRRDVIVAALERGAGHVRAGAVAEAGHHERVEFETAVVTSRHVFDLRDGCGDVREPDREEVTRERGVVVGRADLLHLVAE